MSRALRVGVLTGGGDAPGLNAVIMAAGAGLLLGSVSYDLVEEALGAAGFLWVALWFFAGSAIFVLGDVLLDRRGARKRKNPSGAARPPPELLASENSVGAGAYVSFRG